MAEFISLYSGSSGNSSVVRCGQQYLIIDMGKGVRAAYDSFRRAGVRDAELKLYPGLRHEILNEDCRAQVYDDLWEWIERHNG